jgi:hypothetical protein
MGALSSVPATDLGAIVIREALSRAGVAGDQVDDVLMGCILQGGLGQGPARQSAIAAGVPLPKHGVLDTEKFNTLRTLREPSPANPFDGVPDDVEAAVIEQVAALLSPTPTPRDELARALGLPIGTVAAALLELNLMGRAELLPGGLAATGSP